MHSAEHFIQIDETSRKSVILLLRLSFLVKLTENFLNNFLSRLKTFGRPIFVDLVQLSFRSLKDIIERSRFVFRERRNLRRTGNELTPDTFFLNNPRIRFSA